jgi:hypothetical protein
MEAIHSAGPDPGSLVPLLVVVMFLILIVSVTVKSFTQSRAQQRQK